MDSLFGTLTVSELTKRIRDLLESTPAFQSVWVTGEISNLVVSSAGHAYFTLKDSGSQVRCVMFRNQARAIRGLPPTGSAVVVHGRITLYEPQGQYQIHADVVQRSGIGELYLKFEELRARLETEGLFAETRKRPLPEFPRRVGVVTSPTGAVIRDIINVVERRYPLVELVVSPTLVQGADAPPAIVRALERLVLLGDIDVVVVARGGGSIEDLWPFNDERVARAIYSCPVPVVSAVGHETDYSIADWVADVRAPTPSAAAELIVPDARDLRTRVADRVARLDQFVLARLDAKRSDVAEAEARVDAHSPQASVDRYRLRIDELLRTAEAALRTRLDLDRERVAGRSLQLAALDPFAVLTRGYSICTVAPTGRVVKSVQDVSPGASIAVRVSDGSFAGFVGSSPKPAPAEVAH